MNSTPAKKFDQDDKKEIEMLSTPPKSQLESEWERVLETTPPSSKTGETLSLAEVEQRMERDGMKTYIIHDKEDCTTDKQTVYFLYGTQFAWEAKRAKRVARVKKFLGDAGVEKRMKYILKHDQNHSNDLELRALWSYGQKAVLRYEKQDNAKTIFTGRETAYSENYQVSQNCYLHAIAAVLTNKRAFGSKGNAYKVRAIGASTIVRRFFRGARLESRVVENRGGCSKTLLAELICRSGSVLCAFPLMEGEEKICARFFDKYGPALVRRFRTDAHFSSKTQKVPQEAGENYIHQFDHVDGKPTHKLLWLGASTEDELLVFRQIEAANESTTSTHGRTLDASAAIVPGLTATTDSSDDEESGGMLDEADDMEDDAEERNQGLHAMIAIGHRFTMEISGQKKYWFLLQNTWKQMPLIEVSAKYLVEHLKHPSGVNGELLFLHGDLSNMSTTLSFCGGLFQEASFDDGGEAYDEEMDDRQLEGKK